MWGNNETMTAKKRGTLGPVGLKREKTNYTDLPLQWGKLTLNWKTATLFHRTEKLHKITYTTTNVSRRYNSSSSGTKSKHRVESIGSLKTGNNGKINATNLRNQKIHPFTAKRISLLREFLTKHIDRKWQDTEILKKYFVTGAFYPKWLLQRVLPTKMISSTRAFYPTWLLQRELSIKMTLSTGAIFQG